MRTGRYLGPVSAVLFAVLLVTGVWGWQQSFPSRRFSDEEPARPVQAGAPQTEYSFARVIYRNAGGFGWGYRGGSWATDYPKADRQFLECAEAAGADFLVTGNKRHFPARWGDTLVVDARALVEVAASRLRR
jgi:hypothetical protein